MPLSVPRAASVIVPTLPYLCILAFALSLLLLPPSLLAMDAASTPPPDDRTQTPPALPQVAPRRQPSTESSSQLALLLSKALADADSLRIQLRAEAGRASRLEKDLALLAGSKDVSGDVAALSRERLLDADARADRAERCVALSSLH